MPLSVVLNHSNGGTTNTIASNGHKLLRAAATLSDTSEITEPVSFATQEQVRMKCAGCLFAATAHLHSLMILLYD